MQDDSPKKKKSWLWRIFMICLCGGIFFAVVFGVLANLGGNSQPLKESIEQYLGEATPYEARIGQLNHMNFFPVIIIDFANLTLRPDGYPTGDSVIEAEKVFFAASFWDVMTRSGKIGTLHVSNMNARPETLLKQPLYLQELSILTNAKGEEAVLRGEGKIAAVPFFAAIGLEVFGSLPRQYYRIGREKNIEAGLGDFHLTAQMTDIPGEGADIKNLIVKKTDNLLSGHLQLRRTEDAITLQGTLHLQAQGTQIRPDLKINSDAITGMIKTSSFNADDFAPESPLNEFAKRGIL